MEVLSQKPTTAWAEVDEQGRLILPPEVARSMGCILAQRSASMKGIILSACTAL